MSYLEELLPEFRKGTKIRCTDWEPHCFVYCKNGVVYDQNEQVMPRLTFSHIVSDNWELYQEPELDYDYIIKNKCLCYFWNSLGKAKYLNYLQAKEEHTFRDELGSCWDNCRPVRRDEVTFYEEIN